MASITRPFGCLKRIVSPLAESAKPLVGIYISIRCQALDRTRELIEAIVTTVAHQAAEANAQIRIEPLPAIVSDRLALEQIFSNLIDNALKYLKPGVPGDVTVRGRTKLGFAIFEIADNGRGIDPKDHQRIFDLFRRAGTQDKPGQGIGLAHVRTLVRRLGGTMSVSSELQGGSTFTITLPINWTVRNRNKDS